MGRGLFYDDLFQGMGQDMTFSLDDPDVAAAARGTTTATRTTTTTAKSGGAPAYIPPAPPSKSGGAPAYIPPGSPMTYPAPASDNTVLYVVGGVAVVGLLAALAMSGGRRVTSNRGRRGRRSRLRSR